jgi:hypothetical protein
MTLLMTHMATLARNGMTTLLLDVVFMMILISSPQISVALAEEEQSKIQTLLNLSLKHALMMTRLKILTETLAQIGMTIILLVVEITMMWTLLHLSNAAHAMVAVKMKTAVTQNFHKPQMKNAPTMTQLAIKMETHVLDGMTPILQDVETMTMSYSKLLTDVASVEVDVKILKAVT